MIFRSIWYFVPVIICGRDVTWVFRGISVGVFKRSASCVGINANILHEFMLSRLNCLVLHYSSIYLFLRGSIVIYVKL